MKPGSSGLAKTVLDKIALKHLDVSVPQRIGHLALEGDSFLRDHVLKTGRLPNAVIVEPGHGGFANPVLAEYFSRFITIIPRIARGDLVDRALVEGGYTVHTAPYAVAMYDTALSFDVYRRWGRRAPLFQLTADDRAATAAFLRKVGLPEGAWFVCVHARAAGYSPADEHWHAHRNVDIADYAEAMDRIVEKGGWCIRMGDATMEPMPPRGRVIDYARSEHKSPRLDIGLVASCRFFLGCASGLYNIAAMFGRPSVLANTTPLSGAYALGIDDLAIPQGIVDATGRALAPDAVLASEVGDYRLAEEFRAAGLTPKNVSPAEIADVTEEMMDRLAGVARYTPEDEARQERFRGLLRPGHYAHGAGSRLGRAYLRACLPVEAPGPAAVCGDAENALDAGPVRAGRPIAGAGHGSRLGSERTMGEGDMPSAAADGEPSYGADYYRSHCGPVAYDRSRPEWTGFFGTVADELIRTFRPRRVFDAGCAHGFLVEALWDRGVEAYGRDFSTFAIGQVRPDMRRYCAVGSLVDPIDGEYDLITCIEVLEHLTEADGMRAIANLARAAATIVISSSPSDFEEPTHLNVQPPLYWIKAFAERGFSPIVELSLPSLTAHTIVFRRTDDRPSAAVMAACAEVVRCRIQLHEYRHNAVEGKAPDAGEAKAFDAVYYKRANPDVIDAGCDPLEHYVNYGRMEGRFPNAAIAAAVEGIVSAYRADQDA